MKKIVQRAAGAALLLVFAAPLTGCAPASTTVSAAVRIPGPPTLVELSPGLWVVEDYDYPVYFTGGFYWYLDGGVWYRSPYWDRDFARWPRERVPEHITRLPPEHYRRYVAPPSARRAWPGRGERPEERQPRARRHH
jgi:hypothetical protein